ncbi:MAG: helix-turn-helix domain-containing protein [Clostridia bacterium]|nr:helix-turn-helix domain-containing protein [Clostridia bacterium]
MEDTFANRLKEILKIRNMKQVELCEKTKLSSGLINKYLKGKAFARQDKLSILAEALDTNEVWLMGYNVPMDKNYGKTKIAEIDIINLSTNEVIQKIPYSYRTDIAEDDPKNYFAIYASDSSMAPLLDVGDVAIIKKYSKFSNGKTYLLKIKNGSPIIRKVIKSDDANVELQAMNMWNFPTQYDFNFEDLEILGEVVKVENNSAFK